MKKMVLSYELHKNQTYVDRLLKEGELEGYKKIKSLYKGNILEEQKYLILILDGKIQIALEELQVLKAQEKIFNLMSKDLEDNLATLDIGTLIKENKSKYPSDITERIKTGKCALKRPGKGGFVCDKDIVKGSKYCKEHLKKYDKITYTDLVQYDGNDND